MTIETEVRTAAQSIYDNIGVMNSRSQPTFDINRSHSINLITEDFLAGYMQDGRMSVVRRFFCLFVTFDLFFISLLWLICILITGDNIYSALKAQIYNYTIYTSLFDVVMAALCRFIVLLLFYALLYINHWIVIALSTSGSCAFLISKVFFYNWLGTQQPVFQVLLILTSFILAWGEAWFLDCRVIPQERHAMSYFSGVTTGRQSDRSPLMAPFLSSISMPPESIANFYSPYESIHNSDEEDEQDEEYRKMGVECVRKAYELLESTDWKIEKVTPKGDTIRSTQREKLGKIYRLTARIKFPAKPLLDELFYQIEQVPKWNPTLLESKIVRKIDSHTDITYQATTGGGGGVVKSRDFVNLRCWHMCRNGNVITDSDDEDDNYDDENILRQQYYGAAGSSVSTVSDEECLLQADNEYIRRTISEAGSDKTKQKQAAFNTLSKSLGAKDFHGNVNTEPPPLDEFYADAEDNFNLSKETSKSDKVYISAAVSIDYPAVQKTKHTRAQNLVSCWAMREIEGKPDACIFEWVMCLDLKCFIPKFVLDTAYITSMQDYMTHLRKHCNELRRRRKVPDHAYS